MSRPVANQSTSVTVDSSTSTKVVDPFDGRVELTIKNTDGTNYVSLMLATDIGTTPTATDGDGIILAAGESWTTYNYTGAVYGIANTADCDVSVAEI